MFVFDSIFRLWAKVAQRSNSEPDAGVLQSSKRRIGTESAHFGWKFAKGVQDPFSMFQGEDLQPHIERFASPGSGNCPFSLTQYSGRGRG